MIKFSKMHGNGNEFVIINSLESEVSLSESFIQKAGCKNEGVGFDQLVLVLPPETHNHDFLIKFFNADGGEAMMCLNGIRCVSKYIWMHHFAPMKEMQLETYNKSILVKPLEDDMVEATVDLPNTYLNDDLEKLIRGHIDIPFSLIDAGNLHLCIQVQDIKNYKSEELYQQIESIIKPYSINLSIYSESSSEVKISTYENGVGKTLSCGSAAASVASLMLKNTESIKICSEGGYLMFCIEDGKLIMRGPTEFCFNGDINE
jgi:diaminopimelate epimerase